LIDLSKKLESNLDQTLQVLAFKDSGYSEAEDRGQNKKTKANNTTPKLRIKRQHTIKDHPSFYIKNKPILAPNFLASSLALLKSNNSQNRLQVFDAISRKILKPTLGDERAKLQRMNANAITNGSYLTRQYLNRSLPIMNSDLLFSSTTSISVSKIRADSNLPCSYLLNKTNGSFFFFFSLHLRSI